MQRPGAATPTGVVVPWARCERLRKVTERSGSLSMIMCSRVFRGTDNKTRTRQSFRHDHASTR